MTARYSHLRPDQRVDAVKMLDDFVVAPRLSLPSKMWQETAHHVPPVFDMTAPTSETSVSPWTALYNRGSQFGEVAEWPIAAAC
jgi:hypothetical protein